jgi:hypothetical protein
MGGTLGTHEYSLNAKNMVAGKNEGKTQSRTGECIEKDPKETGCDAVDCIQMTQDVAQ